MEKIKDEDSGRRIIFTWVAARVMTGKFKDYKGYSFCVCGHSKRFIRIARNFLMPRIIRDAFIEEGKCEEGERCLDFDCEYNHTTLKSYAFNEKITVKQVLEMMPAFGKETLGMNLEEDGKLKNLADLIEGHEGSYIDVGSKRRTKV